MTLPKYFKDASGYCYAATPLLARKAGMTPWDGAVDVNGFAVDSAPAEGPKRGRAPAKRAGRYPLGEDAADAE